MLWAGDLAHTEVSVFPEMEQVKSESLAFRVVPNKPLGHCVYLLFKESIPQCTGQHLIFPYISCALTLH